MKTYFDPWQNPTYPQDVGMTDDEVAVGARAASLARAQSPGPLTCQIDGTWSLDDPLHADNFQTCMQFRHQHVIGDDEPWTYWQLIDGPLIGPRPPVPNPPIELIDWAVRAHAGTVPAGSQIPVIPPVQAGAGARVWSVFAATPNYTDPSLPFTKQPGWNGWNLTMWVNPLGMWPLKGSYALRLTFQGQFRLSSLYVGVPIPDQIWLVAAQHQMTFDNGNTTGFAQMDDLGNFLDLVTDPLPIGLDCSNGLYISMYFDSDGGGIANLSANDPNAYAE